MKSVEYTKKCLREAGWKFVSKHRSVTAANKKARETLKKLFKKGKSLPEVNIEKIGNMYYVYKRERKY